MKQKCKYICFKWELFKRTQKRLHALICSEKVWYGWVTAKKKINFFAPNDSAFCAYSYSHMSYVSEGTAWLIIH